MTQEQIKSLFDYSNGILTNKVSRGYKAPIGKESGWVWVDTKRANHSYRVVKVYGKEYKVHRVIWALVNGEFPKGQIDHIDGNTMNNKIENMRVVDNKTNSRNRSVQSNNTSGYHGINKLPSGSWRVRINTDEKRITVGSFSTLEKAVEARKEAEIKYGYHTNHGRK